MHITEIRGLEGLHEGVDKRWVWKTKEAYNLAQDCLKKIGISIRDLNDEIKSGKTRSIKDFVYCIILVDWIIESLNTIQKSLMQEIQHAFVFDKNSEVKKGNSYIKAVRSFVIAHPFTTTKHKEYGLDGDFICVDYIGGFTALMKLISKSDRFYHLGINGIVQFDEAFGEDVFLIAYSHTKDKMEFGNYIGVSMSDVFNVAEMYIEKLYALDKFIRKQKRRNYK